MEYQERVGLEVSLEQADDALSCIDDSDILSKNQRIQIARARQFIQNTMKENSGRIRIDECWLRGALSESKEGSL